jgi:hypothetical protein
MLEIIIILTVLFFIAVLFYKQANEQFEILQITGERIHELPTMYVDRSPIVVSDFPTPSLGSEEALQKRPSILQMTVLPNMSLKELLGSSELSTFQFSSATAEFLAKESGLSVWFDHHLFNTLVPQYTSWFYSSKASLWPHHRGMYKTTAFQTIIMPTQGTVNVSLMLGKVLPYLPTRWEGRQFHSLSSHDTPLINQIKYVEIKLRRGNLLLLPAHIIVDVSSESGQQDAWSFIGEIHHPISRMA